MYLSGVRIGMEITHLTLKLTQKEHQAGRTVFCAAAAGTAMLGTVAFLIAASTARATATATTAFASFEFNSYLT